MVYCNTQSVFKKWHVKDIKLCAVLYKYMNTLKHWIAFRLCSYITFIEFENIGSIIYNKHNKKKFKQGGTKKCSRGAYDLLKKQYMKKN